MPYRRLLITALLIAIVMMIAIDSHAQGISCEGRTHDLSADWRLAPATAAPAAKTRANWRFGPFDQRKYGFEWAAFYVLESEPFDENMHGKFARLDVLLRLDGATTSWFRVLPPADYAGRPGTISGPRGLADSQDPPVGRLTPGEPLFLFDLFQPDYNSSTALQFVIDLRPGRRRIPLSFQCVQDAVLGACGAFDTSYQFTRDELKCEWNPKGQDLWCAIDRSVDTVWGLRRAALDHLLPGQMNRGGPALAESQSQVEELARTFAEKGTAMPIRTARWGSVAAIYVMPPRNGATTVLLAAQGISTRFGARFMTVTLRDRARPVLRMMATRNLAPSYWQDLNEVPDISVDGRPEPVDVSFSVEKLEPIDASTTLLRVRASEEELNASYLIGLDAAADAIDVLRVATDAIDYYQCGRAVTPPNAIAMTRGQDAFTLDLDVEPARQVDYNNQPVVDGAGMIEWAAPACPGTMTVTWNQGFVVVERPVAPECKATPPRFVEVRANGDVVAVPKLKAPRMQ